MEGRECKEGMEGREGRECKERMEEREEREGVLKKMIQCLTKIITSSNAFL